MFSLYYKRFAKIAASDLNLLPSSSKYSKQVLAYMYATMSERMRKIKISQNLTLEEMTFAILTSSHFLNPENIGNKSKNNAMEGADARKNMPIKNNVKVICFPSNLI